MLRQLCVYCKKELGLIEDPAAEVEIISHGVCPSCFTRFMAGTGQQFSEFLNSLLAPVLVNVVFLRPEEAPPNGSTG